MSFSFTNQTLAQLDLLRYWFYGTARCESGVDAPSLLNNQLFQFRFAAAEQYVEMMDSTRIHFMIELIRSVRALCGLRRTSVDWHCQSRMD